jgi:DNA processing protein
LKEKIVYASVCSEPKHIEEIATQTGLPMDSLIEQLLLLELRGFIKQTSRNYYIKQF